MVQSVANAEELFTISDQSWVSIEAINRIAAGNQQVALSSDQSFLDKINRGCEFLDKLLHEEGVIYGVTTGYGDSCTVSVPLELVEQLPVHLTRFHGCGLGENLTIQQSLAVLAVRLTSLTKGVSGVSLDLLALLTTLINQKIAPVIPQEGSVGASGDLTPLSYVAAVLIGERDVIYQGQQLSAKQVFAEQKIQPIKLRPKEGLAIMNGTAVMTAIACEAYSRAEYLAKLTARVTSLASIALQGNAYHFDEKLFAVKPHPGQIEVAKWIRTDLQHIEAPKQSDRLQDRYSIRCAPHVIGVLQDALPSFRAFIENEINSANDNPIIDAEGEHVLHGGHFYGGHIAFAMDSMKNTVANLADLVDRQLALLMDTKFNNGLPANLTGATQERLMVNHGFKAVQIGVSAWTAEALKHTMPASVFSRSTECHNQDKVSMGTIAARDCLRVLELTEQVVAAAILAIHQALSLRERKGELQLSSLSQPLQSMYKDVFSYFELVEEDRPLESVLRQTVEYIQQQRWDLY